MMAKFRFTSFRNESFVWRGCLIVTGIPSLVDSIVFDRSIRPGIMSANTNALWNANVRETKEELAPRGKKFLDWLWTRGEKEIAIVTHNGFLFHTLATFVNDCHALVRKEINKHFENYELRSMVIVDKSMLGAGTSTTDYPGRIPPRPDVPSATVDEKLANDKSVSGST